MQFETSVCVSDVCDISDFSVSYPSSSPSNHFDTSTMIIIKVTPTFCSLPLCCMAYLVSLLPGSCHCNPLYSSSLYDCCVTLYLIDLCQCIAVPSDNQYFTNEFFGVETLLNEFSKAYWSDFCLSYLFTNRDFEGGVILISNFCLKTLTALTKLNYSF